MPATHSGLFPTTVQQKTSMCIKQQCGDYKTTVCMKQKFEQNNSVYKTTASNTYNTRHARYSNTYL